ncbi:hypothetical protein AAFF_G00113960 [Aldrovandia affinis]|uniref:Uncharacterized protein n=1 Tax=Aldrovandia affinis TaxID=143900 RepID=A0AAD7VXD6_9TELE|nr:hypothetical protein AAFF_G00113960 [Aldrovandia affinis]
MDTQDNELLRTIHAEITTLFCDDLTVEDVLGCQATGSVSPFDDFWSLDYIDHLQLQQVEEAPCMPSASTASLEQNIPAETLFVKGPSGPDLFALDESKYRTDEQTQKGGKKTNKRNNIEAVPNVSVKRRFCDDLTVEDVLGCQATGSVSPFDDFWSLDYIDHLQLQQVEEAPCMPSASTASLEQNIPAETLFVKGPSRPVTTPILILSDDDGCSDESVFNRLVHPASGC